MTQHFFNGKIKLLQAKIYYDKTWIKTRHKKCTLFECELPWSQRFFLIFPRERDQQQAAKRRQRVA